MKMEHWPKLNKMHQACEEILGKEINAKTRTTKLVIRRLIFYKVIKEFLPVASLADMGACVNKDHSTVVHALKKFHLVKENQYYYSLYEDCREAVSKVMGKPIRTRQELEREIQQLTNENRKLSKENIELKQFKHKIS